MRTERNGRDIVYDLVSGGEWPAASDRRPVEEKAEEKANLRTESAECDTPGFDEERVEKREI